MLDSKNMRLRTALPTACLLAALSAGQAFAQAGLRVPERAEPGLDPSFARGWLAPEYDRFGFAYYQYRDTLGFSPASPRMSWAYSFGSRADVSLSYNTNYEYGQVSLFGRWWFSPEWALSAETTSRDQPGFLPRVQDFRFGLQKRF
jgi:hypothetical protein